MGVAEIKKRRHQQLYDSVRELKRSSNEHCSLSFKSITRGFATVANTRFMQWLMYG
jgi:hypothetical protein